MNNQRRILLGIFFIVALSILAFYTLFLTDVHIFSKPTLMTVYFPEANNLREGDAVQLLGARIGRVKEVVPEVTSEPERRIRTVLSLDRPVELLEDGRILIQETSLLGGRNVLIDPGTFGGPLKEPLEDGGYLGQVRKNPIASFGDFGAQLTELIDANRGSIDGFLANLDAITDDVRAGNGLLGKLVTDPELASEGRAVVADARTFMANATEASEQLKSGQGLLGALFYDDTLKNQVTDAVGRIDRFVASLEEQQGLLGRLMKDEALADSFARGIDSFASIGQKLDRGEGALGLLLSDPATKDEVKSLVTNLRTASEDLTTLTAKLESGQGTLGKLLADDEMYQELRNTLGILNRSLEDYREAAPITAFTSVLFAAF
jgi:phospholipid/cholesterol/gamma-HCH transport system substrate-binding protein